MISLKMFLSTSRMYFWQNLPRFYGQTYGCFLFFFLENTLSSRVPSALVECSFENPAWIYQLKILKTFAKTPTLSNFFWKLPKRFPLKRSSAHLESILDNLVKSCPVNRKKFLPKPKRNINLLDLPRKTFWIKWSSEHSEFSNEKSAKVFPLKIRKLAAPSKNLKLNQNFHQSFFFHFFPKNFLCRFEILAENFSRIVHRNSALNTKTFIRPFCFLEKLF